MIKLNIDQYRAETADLNAKLPRIFPEVPLCSWDMRTTVVTDWGPTEIDIYRPYGTGGERLPVFYNLHGGGYCLGFREPDDPFCRIIAERASCAVVNVGYVTAPEYKFPAPIEQVYSLIKYLRQHSNDFGFDRDLIAVGGHSAGGGIAAAVAILCAHRDEFPLTTQILNFPYLDLATPPAHKNWGDIPLDAKLELINVFENYVAWYLNKDSDSSNMLASPVNATAEDIVGVCPALFIVAGKDSLSDEANRYASLLMSSGIEVHYRCFPNSIHGFTHILPAEPARDAWKLMWNHLKKAFTR